MTKDQAITIAQQFVKDNPPGEELSGVLRVVLIKQDLRRDQYKDMGDLWSISFPGVTSPDYVQDPSGVMVDVEDSTGEARYFMQL